MIFRLAFSSGLRFFRAITSIHVAILHQNGGLHKVWDGLDSDDIDSTFYLNTAPKTLRLPSNLKTIEAEAFSNTSIEVLICGDVLTSIGDDAFSDCYDLIVVCARGSYAEAWAQDNGYSISYE